jgi:hypothetical protein
LNNRNNDGSGAIASNETTSLIDEKLAGDYDRNNDGNDAIVSNKTSVTDEKLADDYKEGDKSKVSRGAGTEENIDVTLKESYIGIKAGDVDGFEG